MSCNVISQNQQTIDHSILFLLTYYLLTYLLKSNTGTRFQQPGTRLQNRFLLAHLIEKNSLID